MMMRTMILLLLVPSMCIADAASQTDWSGGPTFGGVVLSWTNVFSSADGVDWSVSPGQLLLEASSANPADDGLSGPGSEDYLLEGFAFSSILNTQCEPDWGAILWSADTPTGTHAYFNVRASDTYWEMGDWSDTITSPSALGSYLTDGDRYFQYRAFLSTGSSAVTPALNEITITWTPLLGTGAGLAGLSVYDISGRAIQEAGSVEYQPGWHTMQLGEFRPGIYFVRMRAGEFEATQRFVVVE
jgi:hypothetical protein